MNNFEFLWQFKGEIPFKRVTAVTTEDVEMRVWNGIHPVDDNFYTYM